MANARLVIDNLARIKRQVQQLMKAAMKEAAETVEAQAKLRVPVLTGHLFSTIGAVPSGNLRYSVEVGAIYSIYVEMGTTRQPAQPFLFPAALTVQGMLPSIFRRNFASLK
ncbi:MAG: HK97-gp10 family putative phage morphogenesis protein [Armatimonadota bacterium]